MLTVKDAWEIIKKDWAQDCEPGDVVFVRGGMDYGDTWGLVVGHLPEHLHISFEPDDLIDSPDFAVGGGSNLVNKQTGEIEVVGSGDFKRKASLKGTPVPRSEVLGLFERIV
jgi:hypothetical protein